MNRRIGDFYFSLLTDLKITMNDIMSQQLPSGKFNFLNNRIATPHFEYALYGDLLDALGNNNGIPEKSDLSSVGLNQIIKGSNSWEALVSFTNRQLAQIDLNKEAPWAVKGLGPILSQPANDRTDLAQATLVKWYAAHLRAKSAGVMVIPNWTPNTMGSEMLTLTFIKKGISPLSPGIVMLPGSTMDPFMMTDLGIKMAASGIPLGTCDGPHGSFTKKLDSYEGVSEGWGYISGFNTDQTKSDLIDQTLAATLGQRPYFVGFYSYGLELVIPWVETLTNDKKSKLLGFVDMAGGHALKSGMYEAQVTLLSQLQQLLPYELFNSGDKHFFETTIDDLAPIQDKQKSVKVAQAWQSGARGPGINRETPLVDSHSGKRIPQFPADIPVIYLNSCTDTLVSPLGAVSDYEKLAKRPKATYFGFGSNEDCRLVQQKAQKAGINFINVIPKNPRNPDLDGHLDMLFSPELANQLISGLRNVRVKYNASLSPLSHVDKNHRNEDLLPNINALGLGADLFAAVGAMDDYSGALRVRYNLAGIPTLHAYAQLELQGKDASQGALGLSMLGFSAGLSTDKKFSKVGLPAEFITSWLAGYLGPIDNVLLGARLTDVRHVADGDSYQAVFGVSF